MSDPKLSSVPAVEPVRKDTSSEDESDEKMSDDDNQKAERLDRIKQKLKRTRSRSKSKERAKPEEEPDEDIDYYLGKEKDDAKKLKL